MSARKLVCQGLVLGPVIMLGFIGLGARAYRETYEFDMFGEKEEAVIAAYVAPMRDVERLPWTFEECGNREIARAVARRWINLMRQGKLQPMPAGNPDEPEDYAAKEQVLMGRYRLMEALSRCANSESECGGYSKAADDILMCLHLAQITKETDLATVYMSAQRQSMMQDRLEMVAAHLPAGRKQAIARGLLALAREDARTISYLCKRHGSILVATFQPAEPSQGQASRMRVPMGLRRLTRPTRGLEKVGSRVIGGPGLLTLACLAEEAHFAALRSLAEELGLKWPVPDRIRGIESSELALGRPGRRAG